MSRVDYIRPSGSGGDSLLLTYGQTQRRSRLWWRNILDQFGAADVLIPIANLTYSYPGGPIEGEFIARHGPDDTYLASFKMTANSPDELPAMLDKAVSRFDQIFTAALADGKLTPDGTLTVSQPTLSPALQRLIDLGRQYRAQDRAAALADRSQSVAEANAASAAAAAEGVAPPVPEASETPTPQPTVTSSVFTVRIATPNRRSVNDTIRVLNRVKGVRNVSTGNIDVGGNTDFQVRFEGSREDFTRALQRAGLSVGGN